jgi:type II secretory pathway pseudopilin PulG
MGQPTTPSEHHAGGSFASRLRAWVRKRPRETAGFTLAGVIVLMTILMVFVAYTVPRQWSKVLQRDREQQTIFIMKQYARAITDWSKAHGNVMPTTLDQLKEARQPRYVRGVKAEWTDPLTGKVDWILVPPAAQPNGAGQSPSTTTAAPGTRLPGQSQGTGTDTTGTRGPFDPATSPKDYVGPFIGVRPPLTGDSMLELNGATRYEQWLYTMNDLTNDVNQRMAAIDLAAKGVN